MNKPNDNTNLEATPATPQFAGGQAALRRRMHDRSRHPQPVNHRRGALGGPGGDRCCAAVRPCRRDDVAGPRSTRTWPSLRRWRCSACSSAHAFPGAPSVSLKSSSLSPDGLATAALVAATGGASSADIGLFANVMFYCAYFMPPARAARQVALGTVAMWAPAVYDFDVMSRSRASLPRALVMTAVLWAMVDPDRAPPSHDPAGRASRPPPRAHRSAYRRRQPPHVCRRAAALGRRRPADTDGRLGVAFVDVNGLKAANTVFGHAGGDQLIRRTAHALAALLGRRRSGRPRRWRRVRRAGRRRGHRAHERLSSPSSQSPCPSRGRRVRGRRSTSQPASVRPCIRRMAARSTT